MAKSRATCAASVAPQPVASRAHGRTRTRDPVVSSVLVRPLGPLWLPARATRCLPRTVSRRLARMRSHAYAFSCRVPLGWLGHSAASGCLPAPRTRCLPRAVSRRLARTRSHAFLGRVLMCWLGHLAASGCLPAPHAQPPSRCEPSACAHGSHAPSIVSSEVGSATRPPLWLPTLATRAVSRVTSCAHGCAHCLVRSRRWLNCTAAFVAAYLHHTRSLALWAVASRACGRTRSSVVSSEVGSAARPPLVTCPRRTCCLPCAVSCRLARARSHAYAFLCCVPMCWLNHSVASGCLPAPHALHPLRCEPSARVPLSRAHLLARLLGRLWLPACATRAASLVL